MNYILNCVNRIMCWVFQISKNGWKKDHNLNSRKKVQIKLWIYFNKLHWEKELVIKVLIELDREWDNSSGYFAWCQAQESLLPWRLVISDDLAQYVWKKNQNYDWSLCLQNEIIIAITPENENPINIPRVPPTLPSKPKAFIIMNSSKTFVYSGFPK